MHFTPWRGYPQLADRQIKQGWSCTWLKTPMLQPSSSELCRLQPSCSNTAWANPGASLPLLLPWPGLWLFFFWVALLSAEPLIAPIPWTNPANHQPNQMNCLLPGSRWTAEAKQPRVPRSTERAGVGAERHRVFWPSLILGRKGEAGPPLLAPQQLGHGSYTTLRVLLKGLQLRGCFGAMPAAVLLWTRCRSVFDTSSCSRSLFWVSPK